MPFCSRLPSWRLTPRRTAVRYPGRLPSASVFRGRAGRGSASFAGSAASSTGWISACGRIPRRCRFRNRRPRCSGLPPGRAPNSPLWLFNPRQRPWPASASPARLPRCAHHHAGLFARRETLPARPLRHKTKSGKSPKSKEWKTYQMSDPLVLWAASTT